MCSNVVATCRGYAEQFSRSKPHMNIGTIGMITLVLARSNLIRFQATLITERRHLPLPSPRSFLQLVLPSSPTIARSTKLLRRSRVVLPLTLLMSSTSLPIAITVILTVLVTPTVSNRYLYLYSSTNDDVAQISRT